MASERYDLVVIGAGAGGLTAARFAAQLGATVALVERDRIGGDCTWTGCVPSKSLIRVAKAAHEIRTAQRFGIATEAVSVRMDEVRRYVHGKVLQIYAPTTPEALEREGIDVILGPAAFVDAHTVRVGDRMLRGRRFLINTGATPAIPAIAGLNRVSYFTYHRIFDNDRLPDSLIVVGGGPLGMEIAQAYRRLGSRVTIVARRLLPRDDPEAADTIRRVFEGEGIRLVVGRATAIRPAPDDARAIVVSSDAGETRGDCLLIAAGRKPNVHDLALERAGVTYSEQGIVVDDRLRTNVRHIYAAGDVLGGEQFSHVAAWQAFEAARNALLPGSASGRPNPIAWVTFTDPEVAQVGLTESAARSRFGDRARIAQWRLSRVDRAVCDDDADGFIKLVMGPGGVIIGATIVAARAGEMSAEMSVAIARRLKVGDIATAIHAYPTYATALQQMAGEAATTGWIRSAQGRLVRRLMGFADGTRHTGGRVHAEDRR
jgi:pyruvate/2-oxoglutarate dehydrogenase complex dihydrolipoamide dehydrogenase (E3) component